VKPCMFGLRHLLTSTKKCSGNFRQHAAAEQRNETEAVLSCASVVCSTNASVFSELRRERTEADAEHGFLGGGWHMGGRF
jgi:hypothetical protein